ncbi:MAG TPA: hypothetical protein VIJ41_12285 [Candidatus Nanopelagicales bacterium]
MAQLKTRASDDDVEAFIASIQDEGRQSDAREACSLMAKAAKAPAVMWGSSIAGFGERRLPYDDGREIDWMVIGFLAAQGQLDPVPVRWCRALRRPAREARQAQHRQGLPLPETALRRRSRRPGRGAEALGR